MSGIDADGLFKVPFKAARRFGSRIPASTLRHKGLKRLFEAGDGRKVQSKRVQRLRLILTMLNAATHAGQMNAPGLGLHPLKGKPKGQFAVSVDENFRVVFRFEDGHPVDVDYIDYHC